MLGDAGCKIWLLSFGSGSQQITDQTMRDKCREDCLFWIGPCKSWKGKTYLTILLTTFSMFEFKVKLWCHLQFFEKWLAIIQVNAILNRWGFVHFRWVLWACFEWKWDQFYTITQWYVVNLALLWFLNLIGR